MITERVLARAVADGLITDGQALALRSLAREEAGPGAQRVPEPVDEERLRFVSGFADIFVTLGLVLFLGSAAYLVGRVLPFAGTTGVIALLAWALAEFFTRRRRMALPSIVLLLVFVAAALFALGEVVGRTTPALPFEIGWLTRWTGVNRGNPVGAALAYAGTVALAGLHYWRFRVPITVAAGTASLAGALLLASFALAPAATERWITPLLLGLGLAIFALAMAYDLADPERRTRRTDIAFWLHLLAAPLIVHTVFSVFAIAGSAVGTGQAIGILLVFAALGVVAVLVDRRAILVSGLIYAGIALGSLISGLSDLSVPVTLLGLGTLVLGLSAGWSALRRLVLAALPDALAMRLPRPLST